LPAFLDTNQNNAAILAAMLATLPSTIDPSQGSFAWDMLSPAAIQLAQAALQAQQMLARTFATTTYGAYLDLRAAEHGVIRGPAIAATGNVTFTGVNATVIPSGTQVSTGSTSTVPAIVYATTAPATIPGGGSVSVPVAALVAGTSGNVGAGQIGFLVASLAGVNGVTNPLAIAGGVAVETDAALLARYLLFVRNPGSSGNAASYLNWALAVPGVGAVSVVPVWAGAGTVGIYIVDTAKALPAQALIDLVQATIAPPLSFLYNAISGTIGGFGVTIDNGQSDAPLGAIKMLYNVSGNGTLFATVPTIDLPQAGVWQLRLGVKTDVITGATNLLDVAVWNVTKGAYANQRVDGTGGVAHVILRGNQLTQTFQNVILPFFFNGTDTMQLQVTRLVADTATQVWLYQAQYRSTFSSQLGTGLAPVGAAVTVMVPATVPINIVATLTISTLPAVPDSVRTALNVAIAAYLAGLVFTVDPVVRYTQIASIILGTLGVSDYASLFVNGGTGNITILPNTIPVLGITTWT